MLRLSGLATDLEAGQEKIAASLDNGGAFERFLQVVELQGGDPRAVESRVGIPVSSDVHELASPGDGYFAWTDLREVGRAIGALGGGRVKVEDEIDPSVGLYFLAAEGDRVDRGQPLVRIHHSNGKGLEKAKSLLLRSLATGDTPSPARPLVL